MTPANHIPAGILLSTAYLPPLEYMACLVRAKTARIELHETYPRQSWRNRCTLLTGNGPAALIIPVNKPQGNHTKTKDVLISDHMAWQRKHWQSIVSAYGNAPYFFYYKDLLAPFYHSQPAQHLWKFNHALLESIIGELQLETAITFSLTYQHQPEGITDLRTTFTPKPHRKTTKIVNEWPFYQQVFADRYGFVTDPSIADLLFNLGPEAKSYLESLKINL